MVLSCSSFGLPSESYDDKISDKEIESERGKSSPTRNRQPLNVAHNKGLDSKNTEALDVSFEFLDEKAKIEKQRVNGNTEVYTSPTFK
jgi:hypothetical protein